MGRHWLLLPDLFPQTVVSFYWKDDVRAPGRSWRIRDYSSGTKHEYGPSHFNLTHDQILGQARWDAAAPTVPVDDPYWAAETRKLNQQLAGQLATATVTRPASPPPTAASRSTIPVLDEPTLRRLRSGKALERMLTSPNSEDWVSWTVFRTPERQPGWWPGLLRVADLNGVATASVPTIKLWRSVPSPAAYERASRARMAVADEPTHRERARDPKPVEGDTEVDIAIEGPDLLWFLEAKVHSDLSAVSAR